MAADLHAFQPVERRPLSMLVARQLREAIVSGRLAVGTELSTEKDLAEQFGVSRSTVREAVRILQSQGLLSGGDSVSTARPRVSAEHTSLSASDALHNAVRMGQVPLKDLIDLRLLLERAAVIHPDLDTALLDDAHEALAIMRRPDVGVDAFHAADVRFHMCLARAGGNVAIPLVMSVLRHAIADHLRGALAELDDPAPTFTRLADEHTAILGAIEAGDGERAAELISAHIWDFYADQVPR